jgi:phosphoribosylanthranilate isomerase
MSRTRIKICGLTRPQDVRAAVDNGADAIGFVFYPPSPRAVSIEQAAELVALLPPFVVSVGLFVNPAPGEVEAVLARVPLQLLQFHGDESESDCARHGRAWIKAARMRPGVDLLEFAASYPRASGILVDAFVDGYGGGGKTFDWSLIPAGFRVPLVLSGGLIRTTWARPCAASARGRWMSASGVESAKGIKDADMIAAFIAGVRHADG